MVRLQKRLWIGLIILAFLSPLGIILPETFKAGDAWGEWGTDTLEKLLGYVPEGLKKYSELWKAPIPDYNLGGENATMAVQMLSYIVSGFIGILVSGLIIYGVSRFLIKHEK
ncbi:MAG: Fused nickel transport protein NikMN [Syntrophorhabdus sp. PtaU1.Bin153]|nr:MAG: Fused nickel transport protein NikMN [Syntrophorhabdus sp. PtaU1.Bin153]